MVTERKKVVLAASRKLEEMSLLVEKQGGIPVVRSLQGTVFLAEKEVEPSLKQLISIGADVLIFTTGIGLETLVGISEKLGLKDQFLTILKNSDVASRGYKTLAALKKLEIKPLAVDEDGTTDGLIRALHNYDFTEKKVTVQLHGDLAPRLMNFLEERGATVSQILPYQHIAPNQDIVELLCNEIVKREVDAICFTTAIQVRSLFNFAKEHPQFSEIVNAFAKDIKAVAVGKVTAEALRDFGIENYLAPKHERMGAMVVELFNYYKENS